MQTRASLRTRTVVDRFTVLFFVAVTFFVVIVGKLAWLQVIHAAEYKKLAEEQNSRGVILPAKRGVIYAKDYRTDELFPLAQNSTTYTIFADPVLIEQGKESVIADALAPLLYVPPEEEAALAKEKLQATLTVIPTPAAPPLASPTTLVPLPGQQTTDLTENAESTSVIPEIIDPKKEFHDRLLDRLVVKDVVRRVLPVASHEILNAVADSHLPGVEIDDKNLALIINPMLMSDTDKIAKSLAALIDKKYDDIYPLLTRKKVRYVKLASNISAVVRDQIVKLDLKGIGTIPEYRRIYPEKTLAAQIVGFLNHDGSGSYGVEGSYQKLLAGTPGLRRTQVDPMNRQITVGDITIRDAEDGASVVLTIDRSIQEIVERKLEEVVRQQRADSAQVIIMDPHTGAIMAFAHYPTFDSNDYGAVFEREELIKNERKVMKVDASGEVREVLEERWKTPAGEPVVTEFDRDYIIREGWRYPVFTEGDKKIIYNNRLGPNVFSPKAITEPYEPGSVFKPIVMSMAIDAGEVTPNTRSPYSTPVKIGESINGREIYIRNALGHYFGRETMTEVIMHSSNIGMTFVAQKLGRATFYDYLKKFGFGERTEIELEGEDAGYYENYTKWSESELVTKAFGQGISVNLVQMATAYSALANGGVLMKPYIISEEVHPDGHRIKTEPETIRRVVSADTATTSTGILIASVRDGFARKGGVPGYYVGGKTGTSQTYGRGGKVFSQLGTTIATFGGYAPATNAKFVMIVKFDRPRSSEWGEASAGVVFHDVSEELLKNYFAIPPEMPTPAQ